MSELEKRRNEYLNKAKALYDEYMNESKELLKRRFDYKNAPLDYGVKEERRIRQRYNKKVAELAEEYKDVS